MRCITVLNYEEDVPTKSRSHRKVPAGRRVACFLLFSVLAPSMAWAQRPVINYDEAKVPEYKLPDPLVMADGTKVTDAKSWFDKRRPELLQLFEEHVYGKMPGRLESTKFEVTSVDEDALDGKAIRKEVTMLFAGSADGPKASILIYLP